MRGKGKKKTTKSGLISIQQKEKKTHKWEKKAEDDNRLLC